MAEVEMQPVGVIPSGIREGVNAGRWVTSLSQAQVMMLGFIMLLVGLCLMLGWTQYTTEQSNIRHEIQQSSREENWTRFTESELEKGRQNMSKEREKDRKIIEETTTTLRDVKAALVDLTKAVNRKSSPIME